MSAISERIVKNDVTLEAYNLCAAFIDVRNHSFEARSLAAFEDHGFSQIERRAIDLAGLLFGLGHDGGEALEGCLQSFGHGLSVRHLNRGFDHVSVGQSPQRSRGMGVGCGHR